VKTILKYGLVYIISYNLLVSCGPYKTPQTPQPTPTPSIIFRTQPAISPDQYYANCDEVHDAGKAPLHRGDPGYRAALDKDNNGLACE